MTARNASILRPHWQGEMYNVCLQQYLFKDTYTFLVLLVASGHGS